MLLAEPEEILMKIKAVMFDVDGTLVDSNDLHVKAWAEAFLAAGTQIADTAIHSQIGKGTDNLVPALLPDADDALVRALGKAHDAIFKANYLSEVQAFPHAHELLARVYHSGRQVVLASSASKEELDYYVAFLDLKDIISAWTTSDDVDRTKPAPDIFAVALRKIAPVRATEVIVVGDTPYDMEAATKCGIAGVAVRSGRFADSELRSAGAALLYDNVAAILAEFDRSPLAH